MKHPKPLSWPARASELRLLTRRLMGGSGTAQRVPVAIAAIRPHLDPVAFDDAALDPAEPLAELLAIHGAAIAGLAKEQVAELRRDEVLHAVLEARRLLRNVGRRALPVGESMADAALPRSHRHERRPLDGRDPEGVMLDGIGAVLALVTEMLIEAGRKQPKAGATRVITVMAEDEHGRVAYRDCVTIRAVRRRARQIRAYGGR